MLEAPAVGDLFGDGRTEIVADDLQGNVYAWDSTGHLVFHQTSNPRYSGAPLRRRPVVGGAARRRARAHRGAASSPRRCSPSSTRRAGRGLDIIAAGEDRHVYAWHADGTRRQRLPGARRGPRQGRLGRPARATRSRFNANAQANPGKDEDQGKIVDTPAVAYLDGPEQPTLALQKNINKKVAYFIWKNPYMLAGQHTFINHMLAMIGLHNVVKSARYPAVELEDLLLLEPDIVFLSSEPYPFREKHVKEIETALPQASVQLVDGEMFSWYGSRLVKAVQYLFQLQREL